MKRLRGLATLVIMLCVGGLAHAEERKFVHIERADIPGSKRFSNFAVLYGAQWGVYVLTQYSGIKEHGSFQNWTHYPFKPHFDFDGVNYNIFGHTYVGQLYYQYYRSRGYGEGASFLWAILSSTAFEFSIETVTERPSFQDLYQTPVFGTIAGVGLERLSFFFHSMEIWPARVMGYIFNPFTFLPGSSYGFRAIPIADTKSAGVALKWDF